MKRAIFGIVGIVLCSFLAVSLGAQDRGRANAPHVQKAQEWHAMGSSPCAWLPDENTANGSNNTQLIVHGLRSAGFRCAVFPIAGTGPGHSFDSFQNLLEATKDTDIKLWAVIIPPSEGADSYPYRSDYVAWSQALARLSLKYKNFRGFNIDDIDQGVSVKTFNHNYVCRIYSAKKAINSQFLFVPTTYDLDREVADRLAGCVDGVWLWWVNLEKSTGLPSFLENSRYATQGRFPVYGGVYAHWTSWHGKTEGNPEPGVFQQILEDSCKYSDGAIIWKLSLDPANPLLAVAKKFLPGGSSPYAGKCGTGESITKR